MLLNEMFEKLIKVVTKHGNIDVRDINYDADKDKMYITSINESRNIERIYLDD